MEQLLRGITIPAPTYTVDDKLSTSLQQLPHYTNLKTYFPSLKTLFSLEDSGQEVWFDNNYKITNIAITHEGDIKGNCKLDALYKSEQTVLDAYLKVTHLIDPVVYVKKSAASLNITNDDDLKNKLNDPWNQAYVETVASYCLGKLCEEKVSPHFNLYYGAFRATAKKYSYNVSEEIESYRMYKWFWTGIENNIMKIQVDLEDVEERAEIYNEIMKKPHYCLEESEEHNDDIEVLDCDGNGNNEMGEIHSLDSVSIKTRESNTGGSEEEQEEEDDDIEVYLDVEHFPVMMILTEKNEATMDDLLEDYDEVGAEPGEKLWEEKWAAWLFQTLAALAAAQSIFGFTHNDLHSSNIVWSYTDIPYLYYKTTDNKYFKVPTYGKLFKLIDFGRSIFSINDKLFVSDDFKDGNDAATQYTFPELIDDPEREKIYPNPSFDLARLAISIFESLFPEKPEETANILSSEEGRIVKETKSDLYNVLWMWLIDIDGNNILLNSEDEERFPDFELYVHIAANCKNAIPKEQIYKKPFIKFLVNSVPKNTQVYSLFA